MAINRKLRRIAITITKPNPEKTGITLCLIKEINPEAAIPPYEIRKDGSRSARKLSRLRVAFHCLDADVDTQGRLLLLQYV